MTVRKLDSEGESRMIPRFLALMTEGMVMPYTELETTHWGRNRFW